MSENLPDTDAYDARVGGQRQSRDVGTIETGLEVSGQNLSVEGHIDGDAIEVVVSGQHATVELDGLDGSIDLYHTGAHNTINVSEELDLSVKEDTGSHTTIDRRSTTLASDDSTGGSGDDEGDVEDSSPALDLVSRSEAYGELGWFAYDPSVTHEEWVDDADFEGDICPECGADVDRLIEVQTESVLAFFGLKVKLVDVSTYQECEHCRDLDAAEIDLTEEDRRDIYG